MLILLGLHAVVALVAPAAVRPLGRRVFWLCAVAPAATLIWTGAHAGQVLGGRAVEERIRWIPELGVDITLRLDAFSFLMVLLIAGVGVLVLAYSAAYFSARPGLGRFAATLTAFAGSMLGIVLSDNIIVLYVFWELTSITSYLLIGFEDEKGSARAAALQALLVTAGGGLAMLAGLVLLGQSAGTYTLSSILANPPAGPEVTVALALVLVGAITKSAQVPFHFWLPGAMAAPTPVSAYLHSATMVKAGVYLIARLAPAFAAGVAFWRPLVVSVGLATLMVGGLRALRQHDLKLLLAYGTVSQLGLMVVLVGAGRPELTFAGTALILAHGLFKAALFLVVGVVDHQAHTRDLRTLSGLARAMPATFVSAALAVASMIAIAPLLGFTAKEGALEGLVEAASSGGWVVVLSGVVAGSTVTVAYGARFLWGAFARKPSDGEDQSSSPVPRPSWPLLAPASVLAASGLVLGILPALATALVAPAAGALAPAAEEGHLYLWHGVTVALGLSALTLAAGALMFAARARIERLQATLTHLPSAAGVYNWSLHALNRVADRTTGVVQSGSLPIYLSIVLLTVLALPGLALATSATFASGLELAESPLQAAVIAFVLGAAAGTAVARRRFPAVLFLGAVGFGVAVLFVIQGAPDLALTQLLVETLAVVMFALVLRHLPPRFESAPSPLGQGARWALAGGVGVFMATFVLVVAGIRTGPSVSEAYLERALPEGGGSNVVNVILTDFRGFDTLGEITVLVVAALGIASLVRAGRRRQET